MYTNGYGPIEEKGMAKVISPPRTCNWNAAVGWTQHTFRGLRASLFGPVLDELLSSEVT